MLHTGQFRGRVEQQKGRDYPYPPSVEGVGPWVERGDEDESGEVEESASTLRSRRREARAMQAVTAKPDTDDLRPENLDRDDGVPPDWEGVLVRQESFIEELLGK